MDENLEPKHQPLSESKRFSLVKRAESFTHAIRGIKVFFKSTHNSWLHSIIFLTTFLLALYFKISRIDWMFFFLASGFVFVAEAFNTALEIDVDLTSPEYHPYAKDIKDVAAGAVLISAITALVIGLCIFYPYII